MKKHEKKIAIKKITEKNALKEKKRNQFFMEYL